jgi:hypothetical protein
MFTSILRPHLFNKKMYDYCIESTNKSIKNIIERKNTEKNNITNLKINLETIESSSIIPRNNLAPVIFIISVSSIIYFVIAQKDKYVFL